MPSRYLQAAIVWWRRTLVRGSSLAESKWSARFVSRSEDAVATKLFLDGVFADEGLRESYRSPAFLFSLGWVQAALAQILGATDLHRDNWLAVGAQPILVDAELIGDAEPTLFRGTSNSKHPQCLPALLQ